MTNKALLFVSNVVIPVIIGTQTRNVANANTNIIWALLHKLRLAMGKRYEKCELSGIIELDKGFFSTKIPDDEKNKPVERGRASPKSKVLVMSTVTYKNQLNYRIR